jgi:hypothetical protein
MSGTNFWYGKGEQFLWNTRSQIWFYINEDLHWLNTKQNWIYLAFLVQTPNKINLFGIFKAWRKEQLVGHDLRFLEECMKRLQVE